MKRSINLLRLRKVNAQSDLAKKAKFYLSIACFVIFASFMLIFFKQLSLSNELRELETAKQKALTIMLDNKNTEARILYLKSKEAQLKASDKEDAHFLPYYRVLEKALSPASQTAVLDTITVNNTRKVDFTVSFKDLSSLLEFLKYVESDRYLENFSRMMMTNFLISTEKISDKNISYKLSFTGNFKQLNED